MDVNTLLLEQHGIRVGRVLSPGVSTKIACPRARDCGKKKPNDPCLSVTMDADGQGAVFHCHKDNWTGQVRTRSARRDGAKGFVSPNRAKPVYRKPEPPPIVMPPPLVVQWFASRGISLTTLSRARVTWGTRWFRDLGPEGANSDCAIFPVFRPIPNQPGQVEVVGVKYRALPVSAYSQEKGCEQIFYGLETLPDFDAQPEGSRTLIICEGEIDRLSYLEAGFENVVSVPAGAVGKIMEEPDPDDPKFHFLAASADLIESVDRIILSTDNRDIDPAGAAMEEELARRIGKERCWRVQYPTMEGSSESPCKDANDVLRFAGGPEALRQMIAEARPYPIADLHEVSDFYDDVMAVYHNKVQQPTSLGFPELDGQMRVLTGYLMIVTGVPHAGKSEWVDQVMVNTAAYNKWPWAICSFENPPEEHIPKLLEKHLRAPFHDGPTRRMTETEVRAGMDYLSKRFVLIRADDSIPTLDWLLDRAKAAVLRYGIRAILIDPYNELESTRSPHQSETEYISQFLSKVRRFARQHDVLAVIIAHPKKWVPQPGQSAPGLYDISGSAHWANKADFAVTIHRDVNDPHSPLESHVRKVRWKRCGRAGGKVLYQWDRATGVIRGMPDRMYAA